MKKLPEINIGMGAATVLAGAVLRIFYMMFMPKFMMLFGVAWAMYGVVSLLAERGRKWARCVRWLFRIGIGCVLISFIAVQFVIFSNDNTDATGDEEYIIALGAGLYGDVPSPVLSSRMQALEEYMKEHPDALAIVSGGMGDIETITEAEAFRRYLTSHGIDEARIIIEDRAMNTAQNLIYSAEIIREREGSLGGITCAVLTNEFHLWRGKEYARRAGLSATGIAVKTPRWYLAVQYYLREYFSVIKMVMGIGALTL